MTLILFESAVFGVFVISVCLPPANTFMAFLSFVKYLFYHLVFDVPPFKHLIVFILLNCVSL